MLPFKMDFKAPRLLMSAFLCRYGSWIPDNFYLPLLYFSNTGMFLHLNCPQTFGEKIQWLKLYDRKSEYTMMVDKYAAKKYVEGIIGQEYIIPTLGFWNRTEDINFDELPSQFVLKATHTGGGNVLICRDKKLFNKKMALKSLERAIKGDIYKAYREWPYKNVPRRIIAEKYIDNSLDENQDLTDYKFYCFNGIPKYCQVIQNRRTKETIDFFDMEWHHQEFYGLNPQARPAVIVPDKPLHFDKMREIAFKLSQGLSFARIDLYDTVDGPLFGEITFYPASGLGLFTPNNYNNILGEMIKLPYK